MLRLFIFIICFSFSSPLWAVFKSYTGEEDVWTGNSSVFHQKLKTGQLTEEAVEYGINHLPIFTSSTLKAKELALDSEGAAFTEQLFCLTAIKDSDERDYILKVHEHGIPLEKLNRVKNSPLAQLDLDNETLSLMLPRIAFDVWSGHYEDEVGGKHYFSLFKRAPGISFEQLLDENFFTDPAASSPEKLSPYFESWGKTLGSLHYHFIDPETLNRRFQDIKTFAIHKDLQNEKFFYDEKTNTFILIDYEDFAESLEEPKPLQAEFTLSLPANSFFQALIFEKFAPFLPATAAFIRGYSSVWPDCSRAKNYILFCLNNFIEQSLKESANPTPNENDDSFSEEDELGPMSKFFDRAIYDVQFSNLKELLKIDKSEGPSSSGSLE